MTNIQAADLLKGLEQCLDDYCELNDEGKTAFHMAIAALELFGISEQLPSAQPEQRWIPCSERLPEKDGEYLTTTEDGLCDVESYGDGEWFYDDVVAWAPLPKPWKGDAP